MSYLRNSCYLPYSIEVEEVHSNRYGKKGYKRAPRKEPTKEEMVEANERRRIKKLYRIIATNFDFGDYHAVLTYRKDERPTPEQAKKILRTLLRNLRKAYQKRGEPLHYIIVTEYERAAIHHHWKKLTDENLKSIRIETSDGLTVGKYEDVLLVSETSAVEGGKVKTSFNMREKTSEEKRLDALEESQEIQDEAIVDLGTATSELAKKEGVE